MALKMNGESSNCRVLLVEDEPGDAHLVQQALRAAREVRFEVVWVDSLAAARRQLASAAADVLLLDLSLPDSQGMATVSAGREAAGDLPLIVLTGNEDTGFALATLESGVQDYLLKSKLDTDGLVRAIRYALSRSRLEQRLLLANRVFEATGEAIVVSDGEERIVAVNPAFCRITGYSEAEVLGRHPRFLACEPQASEHYREMGAALRRTGAWAGEVRSRRKNGEVFPEWQTVSSVVNGSGQVTQYIAVFTDLSEIRAAQEKAEHLSWRDALTGLPNRAAFLRRLEPALAGAQREGAHAAVLLIDLDRFKDINEVRGLALGDALLCAVAERLRLTLAGDGLLARLDSDEFAALVTQLGPSCDGAGAKALGLADSLRAALSAAIVVDGETFRLDASIGIALFPASPQETVSDVLRQADMAMHQAKAAGGGRAMFFETAMGESIRERYQLERELRQALEEGQLRLYLQPQVDAAGRQVGAEALVRWQHPRLGLIPPGVFVPLAEANGLIVAIDRWMLGEVCRLLASLDAEGRTLRLAVNISPRHFQRSDFTAEVRRQLAHTGADPSHLVLEITEGLVIGDFADVAAKMALLTALGIHFSMDDFGTGYSSLAYLKRLSLHELKIDKSFIQDAPTDPNDAALVEAILAVAQHLHLQVVAEGVETESQARFLDNHGDVIRQGYLYGRPLPAAAWRQGLDLHAEAAA